MEAFLIELIIAAAISQDDASVIQARKNLREVYRYMNIIYNTFDHTRKYL
jgi:hypothetical protein